MRQRREALGMSQGRLGRHLGLTFSQIQKYEKGSNRIGAGRLYQIAGLLGVSVSYFFEGVENGTGASAPPGAPDARLAEHAQAIARDFLAIEDEATRESVLALVRSLTASARSSV
jgi:transcriptional regulator with XRE-family HTH domain